MLQDFSFDHLIDVLFVICTFVCVFFTEFWGKLYERRNGDTVLTSLFDLFEVKRI